MSPSSDGPTTSQSTLSPQSPSNELPPLVQSTSFLDSVPVTLTMEQRDWMGVEDLALQGPRLPSSNALGAVSKTQPEGRGAVPSKSLEVELRRRPGEGFGFVIATQDMTNGSSSLFSHRFVTVRRGSPAARSGQIQQGDHLEAVEGRSVLTLPHRELAQILRRAGNTLRLTIIPRSNNNASNLTQYTDFDADSKLRKGHIARQKQDPRYYSVDLERGPTGFGFSLRGGSEYNMGLYVLGLMEGGPASRSQKIQVSDQLVEINGDSTAGMTHSQAVEQIRKGGHRIHLVLKRGNGYVPDYGHEGGAASPSSFRSEEPGESGVAFSLPRSIEKGVDREAERRKGRRKGDSSREGVEEERRGTPEIERASGDLVSIPASSHSGRKREREKPTQSTTKKASKSTEGEEEDVQRRERREREKEKRRSSGGRRSRVKTGTQEREDREQEEEREWSDARGRRGRDEKKEGKKKGKIENNNSDVPAGTVEVTGVTEKAPFSFLMPLDDEGNLSDADSALSFSEVSVSAASISFTGAQWPLDPRDLSNSQEIPTTPHLSPGPWLVPSRHKLSQVLEGNRLSQHSGGLWF
ncbi:hypothetical protein PDJAM_G00241760 [Pangasius djambal]|uniref:Uncharacterized protein n=1 Tax=Pangasius djambal TaxID=1691987 RepID=A0ACC5YH82_9TELE|nr:hypothetical protein [Pangasius djambal]